MSSLDHLRVFISYARKDGAALARRLQSSLNTKGFDVWLDTQRLHGGTTWSWEIEHEIDTRQVTLALISPGSYASEICRAEQIRALDKGNRVIPVLAAKNADRPLYLYARQYRDFTDTADYDARLTELIADICSDATATLPDTYRKTRLTYLTAPPRIANYLERTEAIRGLRNALFAEDHRQPIALTALAGMGGIGKTVLAKALTDDEVVQRAFPDGIVWITAGKERKRDLLEEMREVAKALGDELSGYDTALACEHQYRTTIANKVALIVVDDVWSKSDVEPLLAESPRSRFLFTTRDASICRFVSAHDHRVELLDAAQSRELLALWSNVPVAELPAVADEIVSECGRLPLALSVVGAMLRPFSGESRTSADDEFWKDTLVLLRNADLSAIEAQLPEGQLSFFKAVKTSFQSLKPDMQERYKALAVLLEDMSASLPILETLWNVGEAEARRISRHFVDRSLAQQNDTGGSIRLHDLQLDYVRTYYLDKRALELIHGAVRLSSHVIDKDTNQFASQMVGRLLSCGTMDLIKRFTDKIVDNTRACWLTPLKSSLIPPGGSLQKTLSGQQGFISSISITPNGKLALSGHNDYDQRYTLRLWDIEKGKELSWCQGTKEHLSVVVLSPDGSEALAAVGETHYGLPQVATEPALVRWDFKSRKPLYLLKGHSSRIEDLVVASGWHLAVSCGEDGTLRLWDLDARANTKIVKHPLWRELPMDPLAERSPAFAALAFLSDDRYVLAASEQTVYVLDISTGSFERFLEAKGTIKAIAVSQTGNVLVIASECTSGQTPDKSHTESLLEVWDLVAKQLRYVVGGHNGRITSVDISTDGHIAVTSSYDWTVRVWDTLRGVEKDVLEAHNSVVTKVKLARNASIAVSACGTEFVGEDHDNRLRIWDLTAQAKVKNDHAGGVTDTAIIPNTQYGVSGGTDGVIRIWSLSNGHELGTLTGHSNAICTLMGLVDGRLISASTDATIKVWDLKSLSEALTLKAHKGGLTHLALSKDGKRLISGDLYHPKPDPKVMLWDLESGGLQGSLPQREAHMIAISPNGQYGAWSVGRNTVGIWDLRTGKLQRKLRSNGDVLLFLPSGARLLIHNWQMAEVWRVDNWEKEMTMDWQFSGGLISTRVVKASEDSRYLVACGHRRIMVWDLQLQRKAWEAFVDNDVSQLVMGPSGQFFISASYDGSILVWDLPGGHRRAAFTADYQIGSCDVSSDGYRIIAGDSGGIVHILRVGAVE